MTKILTMCMAMCVLCGNLLAAGKPPTPGQNFKVPLRGSALTYQWNKNGSKIEGATDSSYTIDEVKKKDEGSYTVTVSDGTNTETSRAAKLTLLDFGIKDVKSRYCSGKYGSGNGRHVYFLSALVGG